MDTIQLYQAFIFSHLYRWMKRNQVNKQKREAKKNLMVKKLNNYFFWFYFLVKRKYKKPQVKKELTLNLRI